MKGQLNFEDAYPDLSAATMKADVIQAGLERESALWEAARATHELEDACLAITGHHGASLADLQLMTGLRPGQLRRMLRNASSRADRWGR